MKIEDYKQAQKLLDKFETITHAKAEIRSRIDNGGAFNLHSNYFDKEFINSIANQIEFYIKGKLKQLEKEFEEL